MSPSTTTTTISTEDDGGQSQNKQSESEIDSLWYQLEMNTKE